MNDGVATVNVPPCAQWFSSAACSAVMTASFWSLPTFEDVGQVIFIEKYFGSAMRALAATDWLANG